MEKPQVLRRGYLRQLAAFRDRPEFVKVITGVRRCGKSTLMQQFIDVLRQDGVPPARILRYGLEDPEYYDVRTGDDLAARVLPQIPKGVRVYVFFDEIQRAEGWERLVNALLAGTDADLYITGSNAHLLSSELTTYLTGRYVAIRMLPLSYAEWKELRAPDQDDQTAFRRYLVYGGFPAIDPALGDGAVRTALRDLYASVVKWDVAARGQVRSLEELDRLTVYLMENVGNPLSVNAVVTGLKANRGLVERYLARLEEAFVFYRADRYDLPSTALSPSPKYYAVDPGLRDMAVGFTQQDLGRVLENVVYLELLRRGDTVQVGKYGVREIDFVARGPQGGREYFQVCLSLDGAETAARELGALQAVRDSFPKTVLTLDPVVAHVTADGIRVRCVTEWLREP